MKSGHRTALLLQYKGFIATLRNCYPDITRQEVIIAILLRAGLSSRTIATRMNTSLRTIENHRYNIRKKVGLSTNEDIAEFMRGLDGESPMLYFSIEHDAIHE
jgi:AraC family transcriptional regulator, chitin signaling transcriptional activator